MIPNEYQDLTASNPALCIYAISGVNTGKVYYGKTDRTFSTRINEHRRGLAKNTSAQIKLQNFYNCYGAQSLIPFVVAKAQTEDELDALEKRLIAESKAQRLSLNILEGGSDGTREIGKRREKTWQLLDAKGQVITFKNYVRFCDSNGYGRAAIWAVLKGSKHSAYGYRNVGEQGKSYTLTTPQGQTVTTDNLVALAKDYPAANANYLYLVAIGKRFDYAGFTNPAKLRPIPKAPKPKLTKEEQYKAQIEKQKASYHALTPEKRKALNLQTWLRRKDNPERIAKTKEAAKQWKRRNKERIAAYNKLYQQRQKEQERTTYTPA